MNDHSVIGVGLNKDDSNAVDTRVTACSACGIVVEIEHFDVDSKICCPRCGELIHKDNKSVNYALSLSLTALILYIPAMFFPFMGVKIGGYDTTANIFQSIKTLGAEGYGIVAYAVFFTLVVFPALYMFFTSYVCLDLVRGCRLPLTEKFVKMIDFVNEWQMLDVFLVGILVSIVKLVDISDMRFESGFYLLIFSCFFMIMSGFYYDRKTFWHCRRL